ncbi:MAG: HIT domain-containing protein [Deltaproteobacteria bacterium]|nr:HIT domain-containing protein [Deltaproteobacteria bacterium]
MYAPWRLAFLKGEEQDRDPIPSPSGCIFCDYVVAPGAAPPDGNTRGAWDRRRLVVTVREHALVILNKYPYGNGHVMVVPRAHGDRLEALSPAAFAALHELLRDTMTALRDAYQPHGMNVGMNMGEAAGAGIAAHAHYHVLPRWRGDVNFLPIFGDTKVISEALADTWQRLAERLRRPEEG